jgi:hypothetical protein
VIASQSYWVVVKLGCQEFVAGVWIGLFFFLHSKPNKALLLVLSFRGKKGQKGLFSFPIFLMQEMLKIFNLKKKKNSPKKKKICEVKILNFQEYSVCPNEIFKVN